MVINHNLMAMNANRQLNIVTGRKAKRAEKLSSGYRINRAADDAAGLAISEKMRRQIRGLSQGIENAQDGVSLCQIADGTLNEVHDMLHRLEELSVKAANGTNTESDRQAIQEEIDQILSEIDRISNTSTFNEQRIFSGGTVSATEAAQAQTYSGIRLYNTTPMSEKVSSAMQVYSATQEATENSAIQTYGVSAIAETVIVCDGLTISSTSGAALVEGRDYMFAGGVLTIMSDKAITIRNTDSNAATTDRIKIDRDVSANITLAGVNIASGSGAAFEIADNSTGNVTITLADGTNNVLTSGSGFAGLQKNDNLSSSKSVGTLTIKGNTGTLTARGGSNGAGIGGGNNKNGSNITIIGGNITAIGGSGGAGIGGGYGNYSSSTYGDGRNITISGGKVKAQGGSEAAGIGSGKDGNAYDITISGGTITATGGLGSETGSGGAGIGGGSGGVVGGDAFGITITGGTITATGVGYAAGIGGGRAGASYRINIEGGNVTSTGGSYGGAGIGGGGASSWTGGNGGDITIRNSTVTSTGGGNGAGIGNGPGWSGNGSNITISDSIVTANGGAEGNISSGSGNNVDISDSLIIEGNKGTVTGDVTVGSDFTIGRNVTVEIEEDASLTIKKGATLTNNGTINNDGTIDVYGELINNGTIKGNGTINYYDDTDDPSGDSKRWWIQCGSEAGVGMFIEIESIDTVKLGINGMDVTTLEGADKAISMISGALEKVSSVRSNIGAQQNRLEHTIANESNIVENTTAAESLIRDADMAKEMLELSTANILAQAGTSVLAQANTSNGEVLMLLQ